MAFYEDSIQKKEAAFPHQYILLSTTLDALKTRKESDQKRTRRQFEKHLRLIEPQKKYFKEIKKISKNRVIFIEADTPERVAHRISRIATRNATINTELLFKAIRDFTVNQEPITENLST